MSGTPDRFKPWQSDFIILAYPLFPIKDIAKILSRSEQAIKSFASRHRLNKIKSIYPGDKFGKLTILDKFEIVGYKNRKRWFCHCDCGKDVWILQDSLVNKRTFSCGCLFTAMKKVDDTKNIPRWFWKKMMDGARKRNMPCTVTINDLEDIFVKQNFRCSLTNLPLKINWGLREFSKKKCNASVDRIDSTKGYTKDNIQIVHIDINIMKGMYDQQHFINICHLIANNTKYIEDIDLLTNYKKECSIGKQDRFNRNMNYDG